MNHSITENSTVYHALEVTIVTYDFFAGQNEHKFHNVVVRMCVLHTIFSLFGVLGRRMAGSGFEDIVIESGVCASGSVSKVMSGKHYNRAIRVHKLVVEAFERLLFEAFETCDGTIAHGSEQDSALQNLSKEATPENVKAAKSSEKCQALFQRYCEFKARVRNIILGQTAQFSISYMDKVWLILLFLRATKSNNIDLHIASLYDLRPILFEYDHHNYARYIPVYLVTELS